MKTFVDNVARQVIERHIVRSLPRAFDPSLMSRLPDQEIVRIASEPVQQVRRRQFLASRASILRNSLVELDQPC